MHFKTKAGCGMKAILVCALVLVGSAGDMHAQTVALEDYLALVQKRHPFFEKEALQIEIETARRNRFLGGKDWVAEAAPFAAYQQPVENSTFAPTRVYALGLNGSLARTFWGNGARLSVGLESNYSDQNIPGISVPGPGGGTIDVPTADSRFYQNRVFATYALPLLQNRGGVLDRLEHDLAQFDIDFSEVQAAENQENFLLDVGVRFIDWELFAEQVRIAENRLALAEEQLAQAKRRHRANLVDAVDVLRAEDAVQIARENTVLIRSQFRAKQAELAVLAKDEALYSTQPRVDIYDTAVPVDQERALQLIDQQRIVRTLRIRLEQLARQRRSLDNITKPQLSLVFTGGLQEGNDAFFDAWGLSEPDVSVGLDFRYPLGARTAKADVSGSDLQMRQLDKEIESVSLELEAQLRRLWIELTELETVLDLNRQQIETARKKTTEEQKLYDQGRSQLTFVIQSQDSEAIAELQYANNAAVYQKLILQYRALLDTLLPTSR